MGGRGSSVKIAIWAALGIFVVYPLGRLLSSVIIGDSGPSLEPFISALSKKGTWQALFNSLSLATAVATSGTALGFLFAFGSSRLVLPGAVKKAMTAITVLPLVSPPFTTAIALTLTLGPGGTVPKLLSLPDMNIYGFTGTWLAELLTYFPLAYLTLRGVLEGSTADLEEGAMDLGASRWQAFRTVTFPLSIPGLANAFLVLFGLSLADFASPMVMGGHRFPVLTTEAYLRITGMYDLRGGAALALILLVPALLVYLLQRRWTRDRSFVTVTGRNRGPRAFQLGPVGRWSVLLPIGAIAAFILYLYSIIFAGSFVEAWGLDHGLTLENYRYAFTSGMRSIKDTLILASVSTAIGTLLALAVAFSVVNGRSPWMEFTSLLNSVLPGTVVGIAYVSAFNSGPLVLTGTMTVMVALCVFRYGAPAVRLMIASMAQIDRSIEEAAMDLGASRARAFRDVVIPLILPSILGGARAIFAVSMTAVSALIFLVSVRWNLLTVRILECITELMFSQAAALSVILIILVFAFSALLDRLARRLSH